MNLSPMNNRVVMEADQLRQLLLQRPFGAVALRVMNLSDEQPRRDRG